ncbi:MAG: alpha-L-fucosidase, partial [Bacteroidales bacterium]|nr:alpha-L-fucosidase [Bacteroidales bacterium]
HGESVYGTRKGPVKPQEWGATTQKGNTVYVHVLNHDGGTLEIAGYTPKLKSALFFDDGSEVEVKKTKEGIILTVPKEKLQDVDTVIVLTLK